MFTMSGNRREFIKAFHEPDPNVRVSLAKSGITYSVAAILEMALQTFAFGGDRAQIALQGQSHNYLSYPMFVTCLIRCK